MTRLVLIPTPFEAQTITDGNFDPHAIIPHNGSKGIDVAICGFGLPLAAAMSTRIISQRHYDEIILMGIAGTYDEQACPIGSLVTGSWAASYGIGAGEGDSFSTAAEMGFDPHQLIGIEGDLLSLHPSALAQTPVGMISKASASQSREEAKEARRRHPEALVEDMETYAVALACHLLQKRLTVIRAISNVAGDRNKENWRVADALDALRSTLREL